jgi:hypothetical protein
MAASSTSNPDVRGFPKCQSPSLARAILSVYVEQGSAGATQYVIGESAF